MLQLMPPPSIKLVWLSWREFPSLLQIRQQLVIHYDMRSIELHRGRQILAEVELPPIPFRLLMILILAQGQTVSHGKLLAALGLSENELWTLLEGRTLEQEAFLHEVERQQQQLQALPDLKARDKYLKVLRQQIRGHQGVAKRLVTCHFPWMVEASHGLGYRLAQIGQPC